MMPGRMPPASSGSYDERSSAGSQDGPPTQAAGKTSKQYRRASKLVDWFLPDGEDPQHKFHAENGACVLEGWLRKTGRMSKSHRHRFYRLFEDGLVLYYCSEGKNDQAPRGSMIMGAETLISPSEDNPEQAFKITQTEDGGSTVVHELFAETMAEKDTWIRELCHVIEVKSNHMKELSESINNARRLRQEMANAQSEMVDGNVVRTPLPLNNVQVHNNPSVIHSGFLRHRHPPWPWRTRYFELHESRRLLCFESNDGKKEPLMTVGLETMELVLSRDKLSGFMLQDARNTYHYECRSDDELRDWLFVLAYELEGVYLDALDLQKSRAKTIATAGMPQRGRATLSGRGAAATVDENELAAVCLPSLLGDTPIEKGADDPDSIQVGVVTWNMNEKLPSVADLGLVLREVAAKSSIVAVCTQECKSVGLMMNAFQGQPAEWEARCSELLKKEGLVPLASDLMGAIHICIFIHARLFFAVSCVETSFVPCGFGGVMFNKGAVAVTFKVYGTTFCFLSNHFAAHQRKVLKRHADFQRINAEMFSVHDSMKHQLYSLQETAEDEHDPYMENQDIESSGTNPISSMSVAAAENPSKSWSPGAAKGSTMSKRPLRLPGKAGLAGDATSARSVTSSPELSAASHRKNFNRRPSVELEERVASLKLGTHRSIGIIPPSLVKQRSAESQEGMPPTMGRELLNLPLIKGWMSKRGLNNAAWRRRYFVLIDPPQDRNLGRAARALSERAALYYFGSEKDFKRMIETGMKTQKGQLEMAHVQSISLVQEKASTTSEANIELNCPDRKWVFRPEGKKGIVSLWLDQLEKFTKHTPRRTYATPRSGIFKEEATAATAMATGIAGATVDGAEDGAKDAAKDALAGGAEAVDTAEVAGDLADSAVVQAAKKAVEPRQGAGAADGMAAGATEEQVEPPPPVVDEDEDEMLPAPSTPPPPPPVASPSGGSGGGSTSLWADPVDPHPSAADPQYFKRTMSVDENFARISLAKEAQMGHSVMLRDSSNSTFSRSSSLAHAGELGRSSSMARRRNSRGITRKISQLDVLKLKLDEGEIGPEEFEVLSAELAHAELHNLVLNGMLTQDKYDELVREGSGMFTSNRDVAAMDAEAGDSDAEDGDADTGVMSEMPIDETQAKAWEEVDTCRLLNQYDRVFFAGDFNYRIDSTRDIVERLVTKVHGEGSLGMHQTKNLGMSSPVLTDEFDLDGDHDEVMAQLEAEEASPTAGAATSQGSTSVVGSGSLHQRVTINQTRERSFSNGIDGSGSGASSSRPPLPPELEAMEPNEIMQYLRDRDQLGKAMRAKHVFVGYQEGLIDFKPTFKLDPNTGRYDTSAKQRVPAWCDRVLFKPELTSLLKYNAWHAAQHSDHRPVYATFNTKLI